MNQDQQTNLPATVLNFSEDGSTDDASMMLPQSRVYHTNFSDLDQRIKDFFNMIIGKRTNTIQVRTTPGPVISEGFDFDYYETKIFGIIFNDYDDPEYRLAEGKIGSSSYEMYQNGIPCGSIMDENQIIIQWIKPTSDVEKNKFIMFILEGSALHQKLQSEWDNVSLPITKEEHFVLAAICHGTGYFSWKVSEKLPNYEDIIERLRNKGYIKGKRGRTLKGLNAIPDVLGFRKSSTRTNWAKLTKEIQKQGDAPHKVAWLSLEAPNQPLKIESQL